MGFAAGRRFLAAFLLLPSGIIRPAMRIIAVRERLSLWAVRPFVRSFVCSFVRLFVRSRASNITVRHATRVRRKKERERSTERRRKKDRRRKPKSRIYYGDRMSRKSSRESAPRLQPREPHRSLAFTIPPHSTFWLLRAYD